MKNEICDELNLVNERGRKLKWTSIKTVLKDNGYIIEDKNKTIKLENGKRGKLNFSIISEISKQTLNI